MPEAAEMTSSTRTERVLALVGILLGAAAFVTTAIFGIGHPAAIAVAVSAMLTGGAGLASAIRRRNPSGATLASMYAVGLGGTVLVVMATVTIGCAITDQMCPA